MNAEIKNILTLVLSNYSLGKYISIDINNKGRQQHYVLTTSLGKYFIKILDCKNENLHIKSEIFVCTKLKEDIKIIPEYLKRKDGKYLTKISKNKFLNVQKFIEGTYWSKYEAPDWLLFQAIDAVAQIHSKLEKINLPKRISINNINKTNECLIKIEKLRELIQNTPHLINKNFLLKDLDFRRNILQNKQHIDLSKLTFVNGHSDFTATQLITNDNKLIGIVDFSEVSNIPAIWELMRFYLNSATECKDELIDIKKLTLILKNYCEIIPLNKDDLNMLFSFNLYYFCQALSVYDKLLTTNFSQNYIDRIVSRYKTIKILHDNRKTNISLV